MIFLSKTKMKILFVNHQKSQCGIYEIGKRIFELFDKNLLNVTYVECPSKEEYIQSIEQNKPDMVLYNYFCVTLPYINKEFLSNFKKIKHIGIIHDPLTPTDLAFYDHTFDAWIIHDDTNPNISSKKFTTIRPIRRYENINVNKNNILNIGSHGFTVSPWKMFETIIDIAHQEFDEVNINMNLTKATFGGKDDTAIFNSWKNKITKSKVNLNITNHYFETEIEVIDFLSKNDLNVYFYNPPHMYVGVGGSADLAISSQRSLVVNSTYMYRHLHKHLGYYEQNNSLIPFLNNEEKVKMVYNEWNPIKMTLDYKNMIERII
jgi:hypothetical protein